MFRQISHGALTLEYGNLRLVEIQHGALTLECGDLLLAEISRALLWEDRAF